MLTTKLLFLDSQGKTKINGKWCILTQSIFLDWANYSVYCEVLENKRSYSIYPIFMNVDYVPVKLYIPKRMQEKVFEQLYKDYEIFGCYNFNGGETCIGFIKRASNIDLFWNKVVLSPTSNFGKLYLLSKNNLSQNNLSLFMAEVEKVYNNTALDKVDQKLIGKFCVQKNDFTFSVENDWLVKKLQSQLTELICRYK